MVHHHYNPFQFAVGVKPAEDDCNVHGVLKVNKRLTKRDAHKAKLIPTTMTRAEAHMITGSPNAFISPNPPDVMRMAKAVLNEF